MAETLQLFRRKEDQDTRRLQAEQQEWAALADEYHQQVRIAADAVGRKNIAIDLGRDLSTVSNWLSCEVGRGFPPPILLLYLRRRHRPLQAWEIEHADTLIDATRAIEEIERDFLPSLGKKDAEQLRQVLRRISR